MTEEKFGSLSKKKKGGGGLVKRFCPLCFCGGELQSHARIEISLISFFKPCASLSLALSHRNVMVSFSEHSTSLWHSVYSTPLVSVIAYSFIEDTR